MVQCLKSLGISDQLPIDDVREDLKQGFAHLWRSADSPGKPGSVQEMNGTKERFAVPWQTSGIGFCIWRTRKMPIDYSRSETIRRTLLKSPRGLRT